MAPINIPAVVEALSTQPVGVGLFLSGAGIAFLMLGHRIFRALIAVSFGCIGYLMSTNLLPSGPGQVLLGLVSGLALAILSVFLVRGAVAALTGGWCGIIALQLCAQMGVPDLVGWALALGVFAGSISLTFIVYEEVIAFVTSLEGSLLCVGAIVIFFSRSPVLWSHLRELLTTNPFFGSFLVLTGTVTGYFFQLADLRHKHTGVKV